MSENKEKMFNLPEPSASAIIWTRKTNITNKIDSIKSHFLRKRLGINWPKVIFNETQHEKRTKTMELEYRRGAMKELGHLFRMD